MVDAPKETAPPRFLRCAKCGRVLGTYTDTTLVIGSATEHTKPTPFRCFDCHKPGCWRPALASAKPQPTH